MATNLKPLAKGWEKLLGSVKHWESEVDFHKCDITLNGLMEARLNLSRFENCYKGDIDTLKRLKENHPAVYQNLLK